MIEAILGVIEESLVLVNKIVPDQAVRIQTKINNLRQNIREEYAKNENRDDLALDLYKLELRDIRELFSTAIKAANAKNQP